MADFTYGVNKTNGAVMAGDAITQPMDFWVVTTTVNILTANDVSGNGNSGTQGALNKLVEIISMRGQPVILSAPTVTSGTYSFHFAIEHAGSWGIDGTMLQNAIISGGVNWGFAAANAVGVPVLSTHI